MSSLNARVALTTAYAAGLRVSEVGALKIADIDSQRMVMRIERCKGGKERAVMLSQPLLAILRRYWRLAPPALFLFPGRTPDEPIEPTVLHAACRSAAKAAGSCCRSRTSTSSSPCCRPRLRSRSTTRRSSTGC